MPQAELSKKAVEDYHKSGGQIVPEEKEAPNGEAKEPIKEPETPAEETKEPLEIPSFTDKKQKEESGEGDKEKTKDKKSKKDNDDPHAENHRKALQEARSELRDYRKQAQAELQARDARFAALSAKLEGFIKAATEAPAPTKDKDPVGYLENEITQLRKENEQNKAFRTRQELAQRTTTQHQQFTSSVVAAAAPFINNTEDYKDAYSHVMQTKRDEMLIAGVPDNQVEANLGRWEASFAAGAMRLGKSPSEQLYALAQKLGYQKKQPASAKSSETETKLKTVKEGQEAAKTITTGGVDTELSLSALEQMSDEQIRQLAKDPKKWAKLVGGNH